MRAQARVYNGNYAMAHRDIDEAEAILGVEKSSDQLFILKWRAILQGIESASPAPILEFRAEALKRQSRRIYPALPTSGGLRCLTESGSAR